MTDKKFTAIINSMAIAFTFAMWQENVYAGCFALTVCGFLLTLVDILKQRGEA